MLNISKVQNFIVDKLTSQLEATLHTDVHVGYVDLSFFNHLSIDDIYMSDQQGDTLLSADHLSTRFSIWSLFRRKLDFKIIHLENPKFRIAVDSTGTSNLAFLMALSSNKNQEFLFSFHVDLIEITNGQLAIHSFEEEQKKQNKAFNHKKITINNINSRVYVDEISTNRYVGIIESLSFEESSGLKVNNFRTSFDISDTLTLFSYTQLYLPESELRIDTMKLTYNGLQTLSDSIEKAHFFVRIEPSYIIASDLQAFFPQTKYLRRDLLLQGTIQGTVGDFKATNLTVRYGSDMEFKGNFHLTGLPDIEDTFVYARIEELYTTVPAVQDLMAGLLRRPLLLPKELYNLQRCSYSGTISGFFSNMVLYGELKTAIGSVQTDLSLQTDNALEDIILSGSIRSKQLNLAAITSAGSGLGNISFNINASLKNGKNYPFLVEAKATIASFDFRKHTYENIQIDGKLAKDIFDGSVALNDADGQVNFKGTVDLREQVRKLNFTAEVNNFSPYKLNLIEEYPDFQTSFKLIADFQGERIEQIEGDIYLNSLMLANKDTFLLDELTINSHKTADGNLTTIESPLIHGNISGDYMLASLPNNFMTIVARYMPILETKRQPITYLNDMRFYFVIEPLQELCRVMEIDWYTTKTATLSGFYNDSYQSFNAELDAPEIRNNTRAFDNSNIRAYNIEDQINIALRTRTNIQNDSLELELGMELGSDTILTRLFWQNALIENEQAGEFLAQTHLHKQEDSLYLSTQILPTQMIISNVPWDFGYSKIVTNFSWIDIDNFNLSSKEQYIKIDGRASKLDSDKLHIDLKDINLDYISNFIPKEEKNIAFGGHVTGYANISRLFAVPIVEAEVRSHDFSFNKTFYGDVFATSHLDTDNQALAFHGVVSNAEKTDTAAVLDGYYFFEKDSLDIIASANRLDLRLINYYTENILKIENGYGSGNVHIWGITKAKTIAIETKAMVYDGRIGIDYLNTSYTFSDSITMTKDQISFNNITVSDQYGNHGQVNGTLKHTYFDDLNFNIALNAYKILILNTTKEMNNLFYGKAFASGTGYIYGNEQKTNIVCNLTSDPNTKVVIPLDEVSAATDNTFITFVEETPQVHQLEVIKQPSVTPEKSTTEMYLDLTFNATPNAEIMLVIDAKTGDVITATGDGALRMTYTDRTDEFKIYGNYTIQQGTYLFSFQNAIRKTFKINEGGTLIWSGNPETPIINIDATYQLMASLTDILDESILANTNRTTVLVQCMLNLTGNLMLPNIQFDLNLPNSDEELNRALHNVVNTDEMMTREIIYLLVVGKFFTPDYMRATNSPQVGQNELLAVVSSSLSSQLNSLASQMFDGWNFGVNFRTSGEGSTRSNEYEFNVLYTPNNRITFNGNVGYRDDNLSASKFIGDFDFEYKLIQSGKLSAKAYTHTNDYKEFKEALTTQGVGLVYRESFNSLSELWQNWKSSASENKKERQKKREQKKKSKDKTKTRTRHE